MIFISYCWHDSDFVRPYAQMLESLGHELWIDYKRLELDLEIEPQLASAIRKADTFLLIDSDKSRASDWVQFELELARLLRKPTHTIPHWRTIGSHSLSSRPQMIANSGLHAELRAARVLKSMSFAAAR